MKTIVSQKKKNNPSLDKLTYAVGIAIPISTLPQAYNVMTNNIAGVSFLTWSFYLLASCLFAYFGIKHKDKLLVYTYAPMAAIEVIIVVGLLVQYSK